MSISRWVTVNGLIMDKVGHKTLPITLFAQSYRTVLKKQIYCANR